MRHAPLQKLVMNVLAVRREHRPTADESAQDRKRSLEYRKAKRYNRNRYGNDRRSLLCTVQSQRAEHETDEQASAISQKNRCRIKVVAEKTENRSRQCQGDQRNQRKVSQKCDYEDNQGRKQCGTGSQAVKAIN